MLSVLLPSPETLNSRSVDMATLMTLPLWPTSNTTRLVPETSSTRPQSMEVDAPSSEASADPGCASSADSLEESLPPPDPASADASTVLSNPEASAGASLDVPVQAAAPNSPQMKACLVQESDLFTT
jgi:hypothetical protein